MISSGPIIGSDDDVGYGSVKEPTGIVYCLILEGGEGSSWYISRMFIK